MAYNFNKIASTYDRLNHIMTLGLDRQWRKRAVKEFSTLNSQFSVLDVACGTGDMVVELVKRGCMVTGVDLSEEMLAIALHKIKHTPSPLRGTPPNLGGEPVTNPEETAPAHSSPKLGEVPEGRRSVSVFSGGEPVTNPEETAPAHSSPKLGEVPEGRRSVLLLQADAEHLPFPDATFDAVTCAFGVRNFVHLEQGLKEMLRVLKPGGRLVILELATPDCPVIKPFYRLYTRHIIPWLGSRLAGNREAYTYLPESIERFPKGYAFIAILKSLGTQALQRKYTFGVCRQYTVTR